ncbi:conserved Plasmodium protein, unknown function [Plasmodium malariae]|uniref:Uncharacterized protein n=1 Tax=Plasmodium malariae TaxID=5858 RepID=A0A1D3SPM9_PLAMA|nr:conserved Plasmodium protein, unknown function [Plasmodium malariae]SCO93856.1 conserved Plasmodium protein, unknown function [Plasmodium malariae]
MKIQREKTKSSTPLRRIPKNRGTVVKNANETNPLSEKEIKNVIEVYSEANKAYYKNYIKNENNKKKKKKKKKNVSKKTESEEFNSLSLNPLDYRNQKFEENGTLLHLPGSSITPKYTTQNINADYRVASMSYGTLHKSNPLSWGCEYKKHYELPTICSIVKSKHPIYSKPQNTKIARNSSKNKINIGEKCTNKSSRKNYKQDKSLTIKKVPTFGNYKEDDFSGSLRDKDNINEHSHEYNNNIETTMKDSYDIDKYKNTSENIYNYSDFCNNSNNRKLKIETKNEFRDKGIDLNFTLKRNDNIMEEKSGFSSIQDIEKNSKDRNGELNFVDPKNENCITSIHSNRSVDSNLSNSTLMEFITSDTESKNECYPNECCNSGVSKSSTYLLHRNRHTKGNDAADNSKRVKTKFYDITGTQEKAKYDVHYKDKKILDKNLSNYKSEKEHNLKPKKNKNKELSAVHKENHYESSENASVENSKKYNMSVKCKMDPITDESKHKSCLGEISKKKNSSKLKQKKPCKNCNYLKNNLDHEANLSRDIIYNKSKKKFKIKSSRYTNYPEHKNIQNDNIRNNKLYNKIDLYTSGSHTTPFLSGHHDLTHLSVLKNQHLHGKQSHNISISKPNIQESSKIGQINMCTIKKPPNEIFHMRNELSNIVHNDVPIMQMQINQGKGAYIPNIPVYSYSTPAYTHKIPTTINNIYGNISPNGKIDLSHDRIAENSSELTKDKLCKPEYNTETYQTNALLPNIQTNLVQEYGISAVQNRQPGTQSQMFHMPIELSQAQIQIQTPYTRTEAPIAQTQVPTTLTRVPSVQTPVPMTLTYIPIAQTQVPMTQTHIGTSQSQVPMTHTHMPSVQTQIPTSQRQADFSVMQEKVPQIHAQNLHVQNQIAQTQQIPFIEKPIVIDPITLNEVYSNNEMRNVDKTCNIVVLPNPLVDYKNYNNDNSSCINQNKEESKTDNRFIKSFDINSYAPYNKTENNLNDLNREQYSERSVSKLFTKCGDNIDGMNTKNIKQNNCIERIKALDTGITFLKAEDEISSWLKAYVNIQPPIVNGKKPNRMSYPNVYSNNGNKNVYYTNINNNLAEIFKGPSNFDSLIIHNNSDNSNDNNDGTNSNSNNNNSNSNSNNSNNNNNMNIHEINIPHYSVNSKCTKELNTSQIIKASNEKLINLQNKQLLEILHEKNDVKSNNSNIIQENNYSYNDIKYHAKNNASEKNGHNVVDNTSNCFSFISPTENSQSFENKTNGTIFSAIPEVISVQNQLIQNEAPLTGHLN